MREAKFHCSANRLRSLFAIILSHCHPVDVLLFWNTFKFDLSADFAAHHRVNESTTAMIQEALHIILAIFSLQGGDPYTIGILIENPDGLNRRIEAHLRGDSMTYNVSNVC